MVVKPHFDVLAPDEPGFITVTGKLEHSRIDLSNSTQLKFESSEPAVVAVTNHALHALRPGTAVITVSYRDLSVQTRVRVAFKDERQ